MSLDSSVLEELSSSSSEEELEEENSEEFKPSDSEDEEEGEESSEDEELDESDEEEEIKKKPKKATPRSATAKQSAPPPRRALAQPKQQPLPHPTTAAAGATRISLPPNLKGARPLPQGLTITKPLPAPTATTKLPTLHAAMPRPLIETINKEKADDDDDEIDEVADLLNNNNNDDDDDDDDPVQPTADQLAAQRQANVEALISGKLEIHRKPVIPKLLSVSDAAAVLRKPFKSPHPNAPAQSDALKRALAARNRFVPWGAGNKPFVPPKLSAVVPIGDYDDVGLGVPLVPPQPQQPVNIELPEGIEPLVLWEPPPRSSNASGEGEEDNNDDDDDNNQPIIVDNALTRFLRPHQREGVQFMFECVCGLRDFGGQGALLCDDMGLGKTLQGITLLWTLLSSGHPKLGGKPLAKRVVICCPTSLVSNWDQECVKWLDGRVKTLPLCEASREEATSSIAKFLSPSNPYHVLIVSYETFRIHAAKFEKEGTCDLLICDEAHRLKNDQTLTNKALGALACQRRVLLSGTPLQNQLQEFYAMVSFANPGVLGSPSAFRKRFEGPILAGREPDAPPDISAKGAERSTELSELVNGFILRRTNALLSAHLPPKVIQVVCCKLTPLQTALYTHFLESRSVRSLFSAQKAARVLSAITSLRKLINHPKLIYDMLTSNVAEVATKEASGFEGCLEIFQQSGVFGGSSSIGGGTSNGGRLGRGYGGGGVKCLPRGWEETSGKFAFVARMLALLRAHSKDRVVIVSNFTQTLELFTILCRERNYPCLRLDGSTTIGKRQKLVKQFNDQKEDQFVFLLSSKAGGCGLNLIGGNRLILFDPSWNPADDKQAAARVWRDGQQKKCYVYRLLATGTIDEKVFQRQLSKEGLQAVVDGAAASGGVGGGDGGDDDGGGGGRGGKQKQQNQKAGANLMSTDELRDLFSYDPDSLSNTYDSMVVKPTERVKKQPVVDNNKKKKDKENAAKKKKKKMMMMKKKKSKGKGKKKDYSSSEDEGGGDEDKEGADFYIDLYDSNDDDSDDGEMEEAEEEEEEDKAGDDNIKTNNNQQQRVVLLTSGTVAAQGGVINKPQPEGTPAEEDLKSWGHHSDITTVPDEVMTYLGGDGDDNHVSFVFSCKVSGKAIEEDRQLAAALQKLPRPRPKVPTVASAVVKQQRDEEDEMQVVESDHSIQEPSSDDDDADEEEVEEVLSDLGEEEDADGDDIPPTQPHGDEEEEDIEMATVAAAAAAATFTENKDVNRRSSGGIGKKKKSSSKGKKKEQSAMKRKSSALVESVGALKKRTLLVISDSDDDFK